MPKICQYKNEQGIYCERHAIYGTTSYTPLFCKSHKKDKMKYVLNTPLCKCGKYASYGYPENRTRINCVNCKMDGMIDLTGRQCKCGTKASFGYPNKKPNHCSKCKSSNMVNLKSKFCQCGKNPSFGLPEDNPTHCSNCKTKDMVNVKKKRTCKCGKQAYYGLPTDNAPSCCAECKLKNMVNIVSKRCKCDKNIPSFGNPTDKRPSCCTSCKTKDMVDIAHPRCKSNETHNIPCDIKANKKYDDYCTHCFANLFPNNPKTLQIRAKSKELQVVSHIANIFKGFIHDKPLYVDLNGGCCPSRRRIDLRKLIGNTLLCIEIDEDQHKSYNKVDEISRYNDLFTNKIKNFIFS